MWWFQRMEWTLKSLLHASNQTSIDTNYMKHLLTRIDARLEKLEGQREGEKNTPGTADRP